jgi:hypothetical protein
MARLAVDSAGTVDASLWSRVTSSLGQAPTVWFRYVGGPFAATREEVAWLHDHGVAVGLAYNGTTAATVAEGYARGLEDAARATEAAQALGAPSTVALFADLEAGWSPSSAWIQGWADGQRAGPFAGAGGLYGNPADPAFAEAFAAARAANGNAAALFLWSAHPILDPPDPRAVPPWRPATAAGPGVAVWQYALDACGGLVDLDLVDDGFTGLWAPRPPVPFRDVPADAWYAEDVADAAALGLLRGVAPDRFDPDAPVTRAELAAVVARIARRAGWLP